MNQGAESTLAFLLSLGEMQPTESCLGVQPAGGASWARPGWQPWRWAVEGKSAMWHYYQTDRTLNRTPNAMRSFPSGDGAKGAPTGASCPYHQGRPSDSLSPRGTSGERVGESGAFVQ